MVKYYEFNSDWTTKIGKIYALLERVKIAEESMSDRLKLRKLNRAMTVQSSAAIEGNSLSLTQVATLLDGKKIKGSKKEVLEIKNLHKAYEELEYYGEHSVNDFKRAHQSITAGLIINAGKFRTSGVTIETTDGEILHRGSLFSEVPKLIDQLFKWAKSTKEHPLIVGSVVHYQIENIHPFSDGNGRIGRLWQTLLLSKFNPLFEWIPVETIIHYNQARYYDSLQKSHMNKGNCAPFIDFMLDVLENSLYRFQDDIETLEDVVEQPSKPTKSIINNVVDVGKYKRNPLSKSKHKVLKAIKAYPNITASAITEEVHLSLRQVQRIQKALKELGYIKRVGSDRSGSWKVLKRGE